MPIFYLSSESSPSTFSLQFGLLFILIFIIHLTKSKLVTRSVPVLKFPDKMHYSLIQEYKSVTKKSSICKKLRHKSIFINNTQLTIFYCYSATSSITNLSNKQLFFNKFKKEYHPMVYSFPTLIPSPLQKKPYTSPFTDVQRISLGSAMHIKGLFSKSMQHYKVE